MTRTTDANDRMNRPLDSVDPQIAELLREEAKRQATGIELIPRKISSPKAVLEAMGSVFTNKLRGRLPRQALLRRLRSYGQSRTARHRSRQSLSAPSTPTCSRTPARKPTSPFT